MTTSPLRRSVLWLLPLLLTAACGAPEIESSETAAALAVQAPSRAQQTVTAVDVAAAKGKRLRLDLSQPERSVLFDGRKGAIDLARVDVVLGDGQVVPVLQLAQNAAQSVDPKVTGSFVLTAPSARIGTGGSKCSFGQTDCCLCGYWDHGGLGSLGPCLGLWCGCGDQQCGEGTILY